MSLLSFSFGSSSSPFRSAGALWRIALGVAFTLSVATPGAAQLGTGGSGGSGGGGSGGGGTGGGGTGGGAMTGAGGSDDGATCNPGGQPSECTDRCPSFDTCFIDAAMGQPARLYYRIDDQRFDCNGLVCEAAVLQMADYCCQRGEFAPEEGGGDGGCALRAAGWSPDLGSGSEATWLGLSMGLAALGVGRARRRRQQQRR